MIRNVKTKIKSTQQAINLILSEAEEHDMIANVHRGLIVPGVTMFEIEAGISIVEVLCNDMTICMAKLIITSA